MMMKLMNLTLEKAVQHLQAGKVIAYPTEAVYGLGCAPLNEAAVMKILDLKSRPVHKGLILISYDFESLAPYLNLEVLTQTQVNSALASWPGPYTWLFPVSKLVPRWIKGDFSSVAVRVIAHPIAAQLCHLFGGPIVSTSANVSGALPARDVQQILEQFPQGLEGILEGELDLKRGPSQMRDVQTGVVLRI